MALAALFATLWALIAPLITVIPLDDDSALKPRGIFVNEHRQMHVPDDDGTESVVYDGKHHSTSLVNAALGCHSADDIRYYRRSEGLHRADIKRENPYLPFRERAERAFLRHVETEWHEIGGHGVHCSITGNLAVELTDEQGRQAFSAMGLDPDLFQRRPATYREAYTALTAIDPYAGWSASYCYSNVSEWFACLTTAAAKSQAEGG